MSVENLKTVEVYQNGGAKKYLENTKKYNLLNAEKSNLKQQKLYIFILNNISSLPKNASVFEVGSADG